MLKKPAQKGTNDSPVMSFNDDKFGVQSYVDSLCDFIKDCETPMTIAIQGDWGSGKTSMMNMIKEKIKDEVIPIWFNTWQFSQFNQDDQLAVSFLSSLVEAFKVDNEKTRTIKKTFNFVKIAKLASVAITEKIAGEVAAGAVADIVKLDDKIQELDIAKIMSVIKEQFQEAVDSSLTEYKNRIVVFVDDLDRLQPSKAVELLEVLKVFLDCNNCVYVLAIDYAVVSQGIKQKYGDTIGEAKGKNFFDKIIQLPFKMPVGHYDIDKYLKELLKSIWGDVDKNEEQDVSNYIKIIDKTIGKNPRSIKRTINAFQLINNVAKKEKAFGEDEEVRKNKQKLLFALLCIQLSYEELYNYLLSNIGDLNDQFIKKLTDDDSFEGILKQIYKRETIETEFFDELNEVIEIFCEWCKDLIDNKNNSNKYSAVLEIMSFSSITAQAPSIGRNSAKYGTFEELVKLVGCTASVINLYKFIEKLIIDKFCDNKIEVKATLGQKCMVFYYVDDKDKNRRFMEVQINKTALSLYLLVDMNEEISQSKIERQTKTSVRIANKGIVINTVVSEDIVRDSMPYIDKAFNYIKNKTGIKASGG